MEESEWLERVANLTDDRDELKSRIQSAVNHADNYLVDPSEFHTVIDNMLWELLGDEYEEFMRIQSVLS